jgi:hypothetical protein
VTDFVNLATGAEGPESPEKEIEAETAGDSGKKTG